MNMKRLLTALLLACAVLALGQAFAEGEAMDVTSECKFKMCYTSKKYTQLTDRKWNTYWDSKKIKNPWIEITAPAGMPLHSLYVCFGAPVTSWEVQTESGGSWTTLVEGDARFLHSYVEFPEAQTHIRLVETSGNKLVLLINELYAFSEGEVPDWVQRWEPTPEKADILFLTARSGDEALYYGGAVPTYAAEQQRDTIVASVTTGGAQQNSEFLNGLWDMGLRQYPVIGPFKSASAKSAAAAYKSHGKNKVLTWVCELLRQYRPDVVVAPAADGEGKRGENAMVSDAALTLWDAAAQEGEYLDSYLTWGTWQVKKLYLHMAAENQLVFDWTVPLEALGGRTGLEAAEANWALHTSQAKSKLSVQAAGDTWDSGVFGLVKTTVGEDERHDDFLEHIYDTPASFEKIPETPTPAPTATPAPAWASRLPELNEKGFLDEGEFVIADETNGLYVYISQTLKVIIVRRYDDSDRSYPLTWFEADVYCDLEAGELPRTVQKDPAKMGKARGDAAVTATDNQVVFASNTDYYTYRLASSGSRHTGVVIRDGRILYDDRWKEETKFFPNLDMLAFYPDGHMEVAHSYEKSAQDYIDEGAYDVYSFGPYLIKDGKLSEKAWTSSSARNPRFALGMVEPGHYVAIMCEGRLKRSAGVTMKHLALLMREKGCQVAINLDGGQTAVMIFMGKQINLIGKYDGKTNARPTSEVLAFGTSELVGHVEFE